jgi:hypothetical protein
MPGMLEVGANRLLSDEYDRAGFLPVVRHKKTGKRELGVPQVGKDILDALMLPGEVYQGNVSMYGEDGRTSPAAIQGAANMGGMLTVGAGALPAQKNTLRMGIKAYHGSPHDFDRFSMDKIGTGEGAQAYGHGLYFADSEKVAKSYRDNLTGDIVAPARRALTKANNDPDVAIAAARSEIDRLKALNLTPETGADRAQSLIETQMQNIKALEAYKQTGDFQAGRMYEVNIDANPDDFLDWDRPLSEQSPKVRDAISAAGYDVPKIPPPKQVEGGFEVAGASGSPVIFKDASTAQQAYNILLEQAGGAATVQRSFGGGANATQALREAGIPGIKYLDAGSRGNVNTNNIRGSLSMWESALKKTPDDAYAQQQVAALRKQLADAEAPGTRNYVVFDDKLISIVKKYGVAALVSAGVLSQTDAEALAAQGYN